ncbi:MAG: hypothetical protein WAK48_32210 [Candidatus Acidiferrum sp.]
MVTTLVPIARHRQDEEFGVEGIPGVSRQSGETLLNLLGSIFRAIEEFTGDFRQSDDRTATMFHYAAR